MSRRGWALLIALGIVWGIPYLLIHVAVSGYHPVIVAFGRAVLGALILIPLAAQRGVLRSGFEHPHWVALYTILEISGPWVLIGYAEKHVASSMAGLMIALTPALAAAMALVTEPQVRSFRRILGLLVGLAGVAVIVGLDSTSASEPHWPAYLALALSSAGYAIGPMVAAKKLSGHDPIGVVASSLVMAALFYLPAVPSYWPNSFSAKSTLAIAVLAAICTALAFTLLFLLIREVGAARATLVAYINPAIAVFLGVLVLGEPYSFSMIVGLCLIATGTFLASTSSAT